ncbi:hypothetical protein QBC40DRAFT_294032 [Triangularia verruculosa]|uniref:Uncharacterized protein n=1 Tax=Triangularia verruculosa TaxID=2587418 RepID=A0AAN7AY05_9PEZI|nr:hypothetical protein QBC40DRAFT_294032 [Triangularia verruculosa]
MVSHLIFSSPIRRGVRYQPAYKTSTGSWIPLTQSPKSLFQQFAFSIVQRKLATMNLSQITSAAINNSDRNKGGSTVTAPISATISSSSSPPSPLGKRRRDQISETEDIDVFIRSHDIATNNLEPSPKRHQSSKESSRVNDSTSQGHQSPKSRQHISRTYKTRRSNSRVLRDTHINALIKSLNELHISSPYARYFHQVYRDSNGIKTIYGITLPAIEANSEVKIHTDKSSTLDAGTAQTKTKSSAQSSFSSKNKVVKSRTSITKKSTQSKAAVAAQLLSTLENVNAENSKSVVVSTQDAASMDDYQYAVATGRIKLNQTTLAVTPAHVQPTPAPVQPTLHSRPTRRIRKRNGTANTDKLKVVEDEQPHMKTPPNHRIATPTKSHLKVNKSQPGQPRDRPTRKIAFSDNTCVYVENTHYPQDEDTRRLQDYYTMIRKNREDRRNERALDDFAREQRSVDLFDDNVNAPASSYVPRPFPSAFRVKNANHLLSSDSKLSAEIAEMLDQRRLDYAAKKREEYEEAHVKQLQAWKVGYERREPAYAHYFPAVLTARDRAGTHRVTLARWKDAVKRTGRYF